MLVTKNIHLAITPLHQKMMMLSLFLILPLVGMAVDLVSPSLPAMTLELNLSSNIIKAVISLYLLGYALGNFIMGFLADSYGRKHFLRLSLLLFIAFSFLPIIYPDGTVLLIARFFQGLFIGAVAVLSRAIFSDILPPENLIKLGPVLGALWGLGPVIGPILGGYLQHYYNWTGGFYFFSIFSFLIFLFVVFVIPETIEKKSSLSITKMKKDLKEVLSCGEFIALIISMGIVYALIITFNTLGPFLIQDIMGYGPVFFGRMALIAGVVFLVSTFICRYLLKHFKVRQLFYSVIHILFILSIIGFILSFYFNESLMLIMAMTVLMYFACGFIFPLAMGKGMSLFRHISGTAAAVMYLVNVLITSLAAFVEGFINVHSIMSLTIIYAVLMFLLVIVYWWNLHRIKN